MTSPTFELLGVLDILRGVAVHAVAGERQHYRPLASILHPEPDPILVARAYRAQLGLESIYLADLDAIEGRGQNRELYRRVRALAGHLWIDAGLVESRDAQPLLELDCSIVAGLESLSGPRALAALVGAAGCDRVVLSLDLVGGNPRLSPRSCWPGAAPLEIARIASDLGVSRILVLDLAHVGLGRGPGTLALVSTLKLEQPELSIAVGGGIASVRDVLAARSAGASRVLVASAFHDGRISRHEIDALKGDAGRGGPS